MPDDPNWDRMTTEQKLDFLKLWTENLHRYIRGLDQNVQLVLEKLRQVEATSKDGQSDEKPRD
jgi:hypothetical protein